MGTFALFPIDSNVAFDFSRCKAFSLPTKPSLYKEQALDSYQRKAIFIFLSLSRELIISPSESAPDHQAYEFHDLDDDKVL